MMQPRFIHLRLHTEYSIVDGLIRLPLLIQKATNDHMPAIGITDQSNLYATIKFYQAARLAGIKPIIGAELWILSQSSTLQRITLLCQTNQGYQNLLALISKSYLQKTSEGPPIIPMQWLDNQASGLIALFDIAQAMIPKESFTLRKMTQIKNHIQIMSALFKDRFYLEIYRIGQVHAKAQLETILELAHHLQLPIVATNVVCFLEQDDFEAHEARTCIQTGRMLNDSTRPRLYTNQQYFRSQEEMSALFSDLPTALANSVEIAKRCNVTLLLGQPLLPHFVVPAHETASSVLHQAAKTGLKKRLQMNPATTQIFGTDQQTQYDERLSHELNVIDKMGFSSYFLIVADFTKWAKDQGIPVGPGRGSGPGSLVAYALNITDIDPLAYHLLFERFLNPERVSMPDFDIDFCIKGRDRVIEYVIQKHGVDSVAQIITYGTMAARAVIRDVGRVLGLHYHFVDQVAKLIPFELGITLEKALEQEPLLQQRYTQEEEIRLLIDLARKLEGIVRNVGTHAGGIIIAPSSLIHFVPLYRESTDTTYFVTQFDKEDIEQIGLVKFDFLGLKTLTIIDDTVKQINALQVTKQCPLMDIHTIPLDDPKTFSLLKACQSIALFQVESPGMRDLIKRLQPDCFEDLIALVALFRPGPLQSGMVDDFMNRKHGRAKVLYPHPHLVSILKTTYGVILYQEQVMQIAQVLAGYTLGSADLLRRAMGKKKPKEMAKHRQIFCKGAAQKNIDPHLANGLFDLIEKFAGYGFNKSHSAAYALITYQTAWLKAHYPAMFMSSVLTADMDKTDKILILIRECQQLNLSIIPPDINRSEYPFKVIAETSLLFGLGAIKGIGKAAIDHIRIVREKTGLFTDLFDFCKRIDPHKVNRRALEALIKAGCFDPLHPNRASLLASITKALKQAEQQLAAELYGQQDLPIHQESSGSPYVVIPHWDKETQLIGEKETLGFYLSGHPFDSYAKELQAITTRLIDILPGTVQPIKIAGLVTHLRVRLTKRGHRIATCLLDDGHHQINLICFSEKYQKYRSLLSENQLIITEGKVYFDELTQQIRFISDQIFSIDEIRSQFAQCIHIEINHIEHLLLDQFHTFLQSKLEDTLPVKMTYLQENVKVSLRLAPTWRISPSDHLLKNMRQVLNNAIQAITVIYPNTPESISHR